MTSQRLSRRAQGQQIEDAAEQFLLAQGLTLEARNYYTRRGEIDLVCRHNTVLVFIEVRYRKRNAHGSGAESVTPAKQQKLRLAAEHYLQHRYPHALPDCRFDVLSGSGKPVIFDWIQNAF
ncbi:MULTISPECIES: YraN family protein [unclassified Oceanobacter]|jgi:putative endonuclease|uniref:YraN family protein n=1 Tax=unclassified Oceanobacter TaxID=2620260 RepID=UPI0026E46941|nr:MULTISPECIES: YraN family protein [unclassified Oceanobacter]MDO6804593.1 YraN family protein [Wenyingzhuangia sp. 1_MG-2023]MDO6682225.1 YraN family protein [Oceanobacter sp. 5_MG-2023]MDP2506342.1 YraN family protein [Oceanobacter sp. 3_MG-2023]MDP2546397.1 YraN family protein [Oceanobacter sp. 4_MG-2023]MDP2610002.1 YraN family protein [Oceanobacter sp. 1_MG-2023]